MKKILCQLANFKMDPSIKNEEDRLLSYRLDISHFFHRHLSKIKRTIKNKLITENIALIVLESNMSELIENSYDAFVKNKIDPAIRYIQISIPEQADIFNNIVVTFSDNAGGFPDEFLEGKEIIDYCQDKLKNHLISVPTEKDLYDTHYFGGSGNALSQRARCLKKFDGKLELTNENGGAKLILTAPAKHLDKKPSFFSFMRGDFRNIISRVDTSEYEGADKIQSLDEEETPTLPSNHFTPRHGLTLLKLPPKRIVENASTTSKSSSGMDTTSSEERNQSSRTTPFQSSLDYSSSLSPK